MALFKFKKRKPLTEHQRRMGIIKRAKSGAQSEIKDFFGQISHQATKPVDKKAGFVVPETSAEKKLFKNEYKKQLIKEVRKQ